MPSKTQGPFDNQFEELVEAISSNIHGARQVEGEMIHQVDGRFLPQFPHTFSLEQLQRIPRYLSDTILSSKLPVSVLTWDHYSYWAWTAAVATALHPNSMIASRVFDESPTEIEGPLSNYLPVLNRFFTMNHLVLFPIRQSQLDDRVRAFISSMNPNVDGVDDSTVLGFAGTNGFAVLDGLLQRHCERLNSQEEIEDKGGIEGSWRDDGGLPNEPNLRGKLWLWRETNQGISSQVKTALEEIDDLNRKGYNIDYLHKRLEEFEKSEWGENGPKRRESFFWILTQQRNQNVHGQKSTQIVGPLVLNLCCLVIWDLIDEEIYSKVKDTLLKTELDPDWNTHRRMTDKMMESRMPGNSVLPDRFGGAMTNQRMSPDSFYPLFKDEKHNLRETDWHSIE